MAFHQNTGSSSSNKPQGEWVAKGYINIYLPTKAGEGGKRKLGAIPLRDGNVNEKNLREWLEKDPEAAAKALTQALIIEYNSAEPKAESGFDLPELPAAK